jgi:DNA (cytosine-5)-methyltransferase 1
MYNVMDLCAGIGGFSLTGKWLIGNWRTVCYVEIDKYCQRVLQQRIKDGYLDDAPIYDDLKTFDGQPWCGSVDIVTAGFPCQPFSVAGKQLGEADERNLWPDVWRVCSEVRPRYIFLENVPAILANRYIKRIFGDLAEGGYDCKWRVLSAAEVGAPHKRDRVWVCCHANENSKSTLPVNDETPGVREMEYASSNRWEPSDRGRALPNEKRYDSSKKQEQHNQQPRVGEPSNVADTTSERLHPGHQHQTRQTSRCSEQQQSNWPTEPNVGRVAHGIPERVDRLKSLGNAIVPGVACEAWRLLTNGKT